MITTVTLNPMLDKTVHLDSLERGKIHRAPKLEMVAGGKGINVSRQLKRLGIETVATGFLGGEIGTIVRSLLDREGIHHDFIATDVMTREGITYLESDGTRTAVFEPTGRIPEHCVDELRKKVRELVKRSSWILCSGSSPCPEADDFYRQAILSAREAGVKSVLDSYGEAFRLGVGAIPTLIKPNKDEYRQTFGRDFRTEKELQTKMDEWLKAGIEYVILTDGANPAYAASSSGRWKIDAPSVKSVNPVGSGDAMMAGLVYGFEQAWTFEQCLAFGAAAGAANARTWDVARSSLEEITSLQQQVNITTLR